MTARKILGDKQMKTITVDLNGEQYDILSSINRICEINISDFIDEAFLCLLPLNGQIKVNHDLFASRNEANNRYYKSCLNNALQQAR